MSSNLAHLTGEAAPQTPANAILTRQSRHSVLSLFHERAEAKVLFDASGVVAFASGATSLLLGMEAVTLGGTPAAQLPQSIGQPLNSLAYQAFVNRTVVERELAVTRLDGRTVALKLKANPMVENDAVLGVGVSIRDSASPRVLTCSVAGDLSGAFEAAEYSPFAVFFLDARGNCFGSNSLWAAFTGLTDAGSLDQGWLGAIAQRNLDGFRRLAGAAHRDNDGWRTELTAAHGVRTFDAAAAPVFDDHQTLVGYVGFLLPLTSTGQIEAPSQASVAAPAAPTATHAPPASLKAHVLSDIGTGVSHRTPVQPVEKHSLRTAAEADTCWPPTIETGFTNPRLLLPSPSAEQKSSAVVSEPGIDRVTGLPNRLLFAQHVAATIGRITTDGLTVAVSFVGLEGIREQRARSGTRVANDSLFLLAKRLESTIRNIEIAGAISQDVFGVLSINWLFAEDLPIVARRLLGRLEEPLAARDGEFVVNMYLGMSVARAGDTVEALFARAEQSLALATTSPERHFIEGL